MKSLLLVRHGQAEHLVREITGGWTDTPLTELGVLQARQLSERLKRDLDGRNVILGSSNLQRAVHTASIISQSIQVEPVIYPEITDLNNGIAAGKTHAEAATLAIPVSEPVVDWQPYPGAESWRQFVTRVAYFMEAFHARQESPAILVSHAAVIHATVAWWLGLPVESNTHFAADVASLSVLTYNHWNERSLERLNDTAHLK